MIQRPQTIYLILAFIALSFIYFFSFASYSSENGMGGVSVGITGVEIYTNDDFEFPDDEYRDHIQTSGEEVIEKTMEEGQYGKLFLMAEITMTIVLLMIVTTIFLYKKLNLQLRMARILFLLLLAIFVGIIFSASYGEDLLMDRFQSFFKGNFKIDPNTFTTRYEIGTFIPVVAAAFIFLAVRRIKKDINLLKSVERLR